MAVNTALSSAPASAQVITGSVTAKDGTTLGYRQLGSGPGVVLLHGSMSSGYYHMELAQALAADYTVYLPDPHGRGLSGAYNPHFSIQNEVEDLGALLAATGTDRVFGLSSGAVIAMTAALTLPIRKLAIYEPPLFTEKTTPNAIVKRFDDEMAHGNLPAALITAMKGAQMGGAFMSAMPRWLLQPLLKMALKSDAKQAPSEYLSMHALAPTLHYDFTIVAEMSGDLGRFKTINADVLLMGGAKSPAYMKAALGELERVLPHAKRVEFTELGHEASWNADKGGQPAPVADALREFFA